MSDSHLDAEERKSGPAADLEVAVEALFRAAEEAGLAGLSHCLSATEVSALAYSEYLHDEVAKALRGRALRHVQRCARCRSVLKQKLLHQQRFVIAWHDVSQPAAESDAALQRLIAESVLLASQQAAAASPKALWREEGVERAEVALELSAGVVAVPGAETSDAETEGRCLQLLVISGPEIRDEGLFVLKGRLVPDQPGAEQYYRERSSGRCYELHVSLRRELIEIAMPPGEIDEEGHVVVTGDLQGWNVEDGPLRPEDLVLRIAPASERRTSREG